MKTITEKIQGLEIKYKTRPGVFSANGLDTGTRLLIDNLNVTPGTLIADLGSGTGVLGILLTKLNKGGHVHLLEDHVRSFDLLKQNVELNNLYSAEVFLSDLFSAVPNRTYHQIYCNPPAQMGNEFLEELITECFHHLKPAGEVYLVVVKHLKNPIERMLESHFKNSKIVATGKEHVVIQATKSNGK